ncbi:MAG: leucine-rich repeat protein [Clostridia bacterium]|nr:leucine-rich repeat protein [Clostridia bacterium]
MKRILLMLLTAALILLLFSCAPAEEPVFLGDISLEDTTLEYTANEQSIALTGSLAEGISVEYEGNRFTDPGTYTVTARFFKDGEYLEGRDMTAVAVINEYPIPGVRLKGGEYTYDGKARNATLLGSLPEGVTVSLSKTDMREPGEYTVTASFTDTSGSYGALPPLTVSVRINKAVYDLSGISFDTQIIPVDGEEHSIYITGELPEGVTVSYEGNGKIGYGRHKVTATFSFPDLIHYEEPAFHSLTATMRLAIPDNAYDGLVFEKRSNGDYAVVGYEGDSSCIFIPDEYEGRYVFEIARDAFKDREDIRYVYLGNRVSNIGIGAFEGCSNLFQVDINSRISVIGARAFRSTGLKSLVIPDLISCIGIGALEDCEELESLTLPFIGGSRDTSASHLGYIFGAASYAASAEFVPESLKTVILSDECREIPAFAFFGLSSLEEVVIGSAVTKIGISAFSDCISMKSIYIPSSVTDIPADGYVHNSPFIGCTDLTIYTSMGERSGFGKYWKHITHSGATAVISYASCYTDYLARISE